MLQCSNYSCLIFIQTMQCHEDSQQTYRVFIKRFTFTKQTRKASGCESCVPSVTFSYLRLPLVTFGYLLVTFGYLWLPL